ncbi:MAG: 4Fe-4S dicluster domain-containing protein [Desulfobacteraceae bacterium]|nr:MAG: 4Fe-4S dicluster domain-containing protein [Desulfobacteraceae bacterium]
MAKGIKRREFLKLMSWSSVAFATGCAPELPDLIPYVRPPEGIIPGQPTYFATTCRECPAGCGMLVANRDGRIVKAEGNPLHPISAGKLCPRGQASLTGLYNPDRIRQPSVRLADGSRQALEWTKAAGLLAQRLQSLRDQGRQERLVLLTPLVTGTLKEVIDQGLAGFGAGPQSHLMYEPLAYEALQAANQAVFGEKALPTYRIDEADFLISFDAPFLETWLSNVEYARRFGLFHRPRADRKNFFVHVGSRRSQTAANADHVLLVAPGKEYLVGLGILKALMEQEAPAHWASGRRNMLQALLEPYSVRDAAGQSGVPEEELRRVARRFQSAARPLALAGGNGLLTPNAYPSAIAANLLCAFKQESLALLDFRNPHAIGAAAPAAAMQEFGRRLQAKDIDVLLVHDSNPVFTLPAAWQIGDGLRQVPAVISFSSFTDETGALAHLQLPAHTFLETWGDYRPKENILSVLQPTMGPLMDTRPLGDLLIQSLFDRRGEDHPSFLEMLQAAWRKQQEKEGTGNFTRFWMETLRRGGRWPEDQRPVSPPKLAGRLDEAVFPKETGKPELGAFHAVVYPTVQFYDGRMANRPWIQEFPDPITQITWGGWVEMNPDDARRLELSQNDLVRIESPHGAIAVPVMPIPSVPPGQVAVPLGQGHTHFGRFAEGLPGNAYQLLSPKTDERGAMAGTSFVVKINRLEERFAIATTSGSFTDQGRDILQREVFMHYREAASAGHKPHITMPLAEGYHRDVDFYAPHQHTEFRWCMVVDLDRCIGCGACVMACYAENNVAFVGRQQMLKMREMSWIRTQRYFEPGTWRVGWLIMLCQHCDAAPCESVCPVFAPHHSVDGLNNQVYNRCFGTRFCSQNDPYKVRRFNWFTWRRPEPLNMQLNPEVTVRQKGIMEKCSFCIQRIVAAKVRARNEDRPLRDGEFTTACAQTCPTDALIFGNLLDPKSRVARLIKDARAYQVLHHLNTKPAVIYLKRLTQEL